jgi:hypothetical protein
MVLCLLAAGCAQQGGELVWSKEGAAEGEREAAQYDCERDTRMSAASFSGGLQGAGEAQAFYGRCMSAKGFYLSAPWPAGPKPAWDATGKVYSPSARVLCVWADRAGSATIQAKECLSSRGTIAGPAG